MKVRPFSDYIMIEPETEFEADYLRQFRLDGIVAFVKSGNDLTDIVGLKVAKVKRTEPASEA